MGRSPKHIALYNESDEQLWERAKQAAQNEHDANGVAEGELLGQIAAAYVGIDGPLEK